MSNRTTRREILRTTGLAGAALLLSRGAAGAESKSPNEKLNIAFIGVGGRGKASIDQLKSENFVAFCDVDESTGKGRAGNIYKEYPDVPRFQDYRKMFDAMHKEIDAVVVSTPNHSHAPASAMALRLGKHVYCEKPLTHSVYESRVLAQLAAEKKVATQMGTQMHASGHYRRAIEILRAGAIGAVRELDMWAGGKERHGEQITEHSAKVQKGRPKETPPAPPTLNWDLWIGPAPMRPYHPCYLPREWHFWWDFGGGELGNVGCHHLDMPFWALDLRNPTTVEAGGSPIHAERTPGPLTIKYEFPARGALPPLKFTWYWGQSSPRVTGQKVEAWPLCYLFVGDKGMMAVSPQKFVLLPEEKFAGYQPPAKSIPDSIGHWAEWVAACKTGSPTGCPFSYSGPMTETVLLGNVAFRAGKKLDWDGANLKVTNCPEAEPFVRREYRSGWTL